MKRKGLAAIISAACLLSGLLSLPAAAQDEGRRGQYYQPERYRTFDVDVLVGGRSLEEIAARGRRYVEAVEGEEYELRIQNPLPVRVAVALSVDGLNTIDARRTSSWEASKWVIEPYGSIRVTGWQMSTSRARKFYFTTERDSYAARLGRASDLGVITAVFYREATPRPVPVTPPYRDAQPLPKERRKSGETPAPLRGETQEADRGAGATGAARPRYDDEYAATGIGRSVENSVYWVNMSLERRPVAELTVRYEYRDALVRLGVLPRPYPAPDPLGRRERARGFEDTRFCPEP